MSFLGKLFGGGKSGGKVPTPAEAIQRLREVEDMLIKKQEHLEHRTEEELAIAKKNGTKNKRAALQALKRKKRLEKQLLQIDGTLTTIEYQREALENASTNTEVLKVMGLSAKALEGAQKMSLDEVQEMMDEIGEQHEISNEISSALSDPIIFGTQFDEDDLEKELENMMQEQLNEDLVNIRPPAFELPNPPTAEPRHPDRTKRVIQDDNDMKELEAWAS